MRSHEQGWASVQLWGNKEDDWVSLLMNLPFEVVWLCVSELLGDESVADVFNNELQIYRRQEKWNIWREHHRGNQRNERNVRDIRAHNQTSGMRNQAEVETERGVSPVLSSRYGETCHGAAIVVLSHEDSSHCVRAAEVHQVSGSAQRCRLKEIKKYDVCVWETEY